MTAVPAERVRALNPRPIQRNGQFVLCWMIAARRAGWNFTLQHAIAQAVELRKPLLILEPLRVGYPWASDRLHAFVIQGMADNARDFAKTPARYHPYLEPHPGSGKGLLETLARHACLIVTDDFPCFFLPRMVEAAAARVPVRLEAVDGNGLLPMRLADRVFPLARSFRRFLQQRLPAVLDHAPRPDPFQGVRLPRLQRLPPGVAERWPAARLDRVELSSLPIDHAVPPADGTGGSGAARKRLRDFLQRLPRYQELRNHPDEDGTSRLSPYLHFGHVSAHEVFAAIARAEGWTADCLAARPTGLASGWWGMSESAEAFLDQLITWRELGFNMCWQRPDHAEYASLPDWARQTLDRHRRDPRPSLYSKEEFEAAATHDPIWNAAQRQLLREGRIHNYLRMLWGKKIVEWSASPEEALAIMIELNDRFALDGRDPNSYSGIFWVLGRYDRAWGPERPIFGTVRWMSSANTARKVRLKEYLRRCGV